MQQRQLRLGDVLDDYCPRERRVTNHAVVAMVGEDVRLTRCTTCDAEHEYKHARVPRQRRKPDTPPALYAQASAPGPKRVVHDAPPETPSGPPPVATALTGTIEEKAPPLAASEDDDGADGMGDEGTRGEDETLRTDVEGPVHRPLIRATLPKLEGQMPPARQAPDFTIRQPPAPGRANRFRPHRGGPSFFGHGGNGNGPMRAGARPPASRSPQGPRPPKRRGGGRNRPK